MCTKKKWLGKTTCDICNKNCLNEKFFFDAKTTSGPWALMCPQCFEDIGVNFGQVYGPDLVKIRDLHHV